ncbi:MAG: AAA family ATPase, partial [Candidatus Andersenbacteria bacterium]|nr:AAA family ATPase [Candidatus Andersenbacteria bacterium]
EPTESAEEEADRQQRIAGIEINAVPPGKKISSLDMLSGGERALASIAILFAIISNNPPPFSVLDEIDAALDEANSARLSDIIKDISSKTQFIMITHNREMMQQAGVLYGVTMHDDGVSKIISLKLEKMGE